MLIMLVILLITFITLKIKTPSFPEEEQESSKTRLWLGIIVFAMAIVHLGLYIFVKSSLALNLTTQFLHHFIIKVGFLAYFIYKTPNLHNYVKSSFQNNLISPFNDLKTTFFHYLAFIQPVPNQIDVIA